MYERDWKTPPILALAFNAGTIEDVTSSYRQGFWVNIATLQMLLISLLIAFVIVFLITFKPVRRAFYKGSFQNRHKTIRKIGLWYEDNLHKLYLTRLALTFLLPIALGILLFSNTNQDFLLNLLLIGIALLTFSFIELPVLTKANLFLSQIEDCIGQLNCIYKEGISCKAKEEYLLMQPGDERVVMFRLQNLSLHSLKNCVFWFNIPKNFEVLAINPPDKIDFYKPYSIQKRNNTCMFTFENGFSISPNDCAVFPIKLKLIKNNNDADKITFNYRRKRLGATPRLI